MQRNFCRQHFLIVSAMWILFTIAAVQPVFSQNPQNPFDIKSRALIDSSKLETAAGSSEYTIDTSIDENQGLDTLTLDVSEPREPLNQFSLDTIISNQALSEQDSNGSEKTHQLGPESKTNNSPATDSKEDNLTSNLDEIKEDITLSGKTNSSTSWWYYVYDLVLLLILLGAFLYDKKIFQPLRKAFVHENFLRFLYRDTYLRKPGLFIYLNILFLLSLGFIIFRTAQLYGLASTFRDYIIIQGVVVFLFLVKHIALHFLSGIVDKPFELKFYQYWMILSAGLIGLWIVPLSLMISVLPFKFLSVALLISSLAVVLLLAYRHIKALMHAKFFLAKHFFQYFLYFCAVEIIPALLLADILIHY